MRWKKRPKPEEGDLRVVWKFLFFPKEIDGEVRWLERSIIYQKYKRVCHPSKAGVGAVFVGMYWVDDCWGNG